VAAQLAYEELADFRNSGDQNTVGEAVSDALH
jgi:hypothetical protein